MTHIIVTFPFGWVVEYPSWDVVRANWFMLGITGATVEDVETLPELSWEPEPGHFTNWVENELPTILDEIG